MWKKKSSKFADRGKEPEKVVQETLQEWMGTHAHKEFNRLIDSRAARRIIAAAKADFDFYYMGPEQLFFGLIEVKSTEHEYRLARDKVPQLPSLRKRALCGGTCFVLVFHSTLKVWRLVDVDYLGNNGDKGSWNLSDFRTYSSPREALEMNYPEVFAW